MKCSNTLCSEWLTVGCGNGADPKHCLMNLVFKKLDSNLKNQTVDISTIKVIWAHIKKNNLKAANSYKRQIPININIKYEDGE